MRSGNTTPPCAIEDWSGAGFHTKQPLNVGQPTVSQVVSSPNNQSCLDPSGLTLCLHSERVQDARCGDGGVGAPQSAPPPSNPPLPTMSLLLLQLCLREWATQAGMANRKASATFCCDGLEVLVRDGDITQARPSRPRDSGSPEEFSFPPDADSCGLSIGMTDGGVSPPLSKAVWSPHRWTRLFLQQCWCSLEL